ncbi:MAG: sensor histidine kinase [Chakrabartia sp.]
MSLRHRLRTLPLNAALLLAVMAALLPIALFSLSQSFGAREAMTRMIGERLVASASMTALEQRDPILVARRTLEAVAMRDPAALSGEQCGPALRAWLKGNMPVVNLASWDMAGNLRCSAHAAPRGVQAAGQPWWPDFVAHPRFVLTPPQKGLIVPHRVLIALQPVREGKQMVGALSASIDLSWIEKSLAQRRLSTRAVVGIADAQGRLLVASEPVSFRRIDVQASDGQPAALQTAQGAPWLYASAPLYNRQLFVFYAEPESTAFLLPREQFWASLLLPIGAILLSCAAVWFAMDRFVLRWLRRVRDRTRLLADGDYRRHPDAFHDAPAEIQRLGQNLEDMAGAIAERDRALRSALADRVAMAREVNHRVKNNLQMISSLVSLQAARLADPYARRLMVQTRLRVSALALVHRLIYELDGSERGVVDTARLFRELCGQLEASFQPSNVTVKCQSASSAISGDQAVAAALIVVEAVTNAFRHGFPNGAPGQIEVGLRPHGAQAVLTITDNGIGATAPLSASGMGQDLMRALTEQLDGTLDVEIGPEGGRTITVQFAVAEPPLVRAA